MSAWLIDKLNDWSCDWLDDWFSNYLIWEVINWMISLDDWSYDRLNDPLMLKSSIDWSSDWLIE